MAHIEIEDTGPGLSAQDLDHVFEPFARANSAWPGCARRRPGPDHCQDADRLDGRRAQCQQPAGRGLGVQGQAVSAGTAHQLPAGEGGDAQRSKPLAAPVKPRLAYVGPRQRVLVVDNEEADRELLVQLLQPLGFEVRTAASGHDALDLLASGYQPDAIFMDLAMPGIDGWETVRRLRVLEQATQRPAAHMAIVSANAFDKGLENAVGIPSDDFFCKPVRHAELLDWLAQRLALTWLETAGAGVGACHAPARLPRWFTRAGRSLTPCRRWSRWAFTVAS